MEWIARSEQRHIRHMAVGGECWVTVDDDAGNGRVTKQHFRVDGRCFGCELIQLQCSIARVQVSHKRRLSHMAKRRSSTNFKSARLVSWCTCAQVKCNCFT